MAQSRTHPLPWWGWWVIFWAIAWAADLYLYRDTLNFAYTYDIHDEGTFLAETYAGQRSWHSFFLFPHGIHLRVVARILLWLTTAHGGSDLWWFRVVTLAIHATFPLAIGALVWRLCWSRSAAIFAGALWILSPIFQAHTIWACAEVVFMIGAGMVFWTLYFMISPARLRNYVGVGFCYFLAVLSVDGLILLSPPLGILACLLARTWRHRILLLSAIGLGAALWLLFLFASIHAGYLESIAPAAISLPGTAHRLAWFLIAAPHRFFEHTLYGPLPRLSLPFVYALAALWLASHLLVARAHRLLLACTWLMWLPTLYLVAAARADTLKNLYIVDRYFVFFLLPLLLHAALLTRPLWHAVDRLWTGPRRSRLLAFLLLLTPLALIGWRASSNVDAQLRFEHRLEVASARARTYQRELARTIRDFASRGPVVMTNVAIPAEWIHRFHYTLLFAVYSNAPQGIFGLTVVERPLSARETERMNLILDEWLRRTEQPADTIRMVDGLPRYRSPHPILIDFATKPHSAETRSGFFPWRDYARWMGATGVLSMGVVRSQFFSVWARIPPGEPAIPVDVFVDGDRIGEITVEGSDVQQYLVGAFWLQLDPRTVTLELRARRTWKRELPRDNSAPYDERSIQVHRIEWLLQ